LRCGHRAKHDRLPFPATHQKIFQNFGMFLAHHRTVINQPQFTTNPPHLHHKNTTQKTHTFPTPLKNA
jgi:hypothetical protein